MTVAGSMPSTRLRAARALCRWIPPLVAPRTRDLIYPAALARAENHTFTVALPTGSPFTGTTADFVAYPVSVQGYFNWRNLAIARAVCSEGDVIIDVGANVGSETIGYSDIVGSAGAVHAFEPFPPNLELLQLNCSQTRHRNVTVHPLALGDRHGEVHFVAPPRENSGVGHVVESDGHRGSGLSAAGSMTVRCATLDSFLPQLGRPRLIAIDAEGHEASIVGGAERLLRKHRPVLVLEVVRVLLARAGKSPEELARRLQELDYELYEITRFRIALLDQRDGRMPDAAEWVAVPAPGGDEADRIRRVIRRSGLMPCVSGLNPLCGPFRRR